MSMSRDRAKLPRIRFSSIKMTLDTYSHAIPSMGSDAVERPAAAVGA